VSQHVTHSSPIGRVDGALGKRAHDAAHLGLTYCFVMRTLRGTIICWSEFIRAPSFQAPPGDRNRGAPTVSR
jgi:hypothetical protein